MYITSGLPVHRAAPEAVWGLGKAGLVWGTGEGGWALQDGTVIQESSSHLLHETYDRGVVLLLVR